MNLARRANKYIDETTPWTLAKDEENRDRLMTVMFCLIETIRQIAVLLQPFMPDTAAKIFTQIGSSLTSFESLSAFGENDIAAVGPPEALFARIDEKKKLEELHAFAEAQMKAAAAKKEKKADKQPEDVAQITIDDFAKVSLRVAQVRACEKVPKSNKLYKLLLDDGEGERQIVSGIAKRYTEEELIGKKVIVVANLKPAKLCGVESNGMLLAADTADGAAKVLFVDESVENGAAIH